MMDSKRLLLFIALILSGFMLWNAWQKDYPETTSQQSSEINNPALMQTSRGPEANIINAQAQADPTVTAASTSNSSTPSSAGAYPQALQQIVGVSTENALPNSVVRVKTDLLEVAIDLAGGDILQSKLLKYGESSERKDIPYTLLSPKAHDRYIAESGLLHANKDNQPVQYQSAQQNYTMSAKQNELTVILTGKTDNGLSVTKKFIFNRDDYVVNVQYQITNDSAENRTLQTFAQLTRKWPVNQEEQSFLHAMTTYTGAAYSTAQKTFQKVSFKDMTKQNINQTSTGGWVGMVQQYFLSAWIPNPQDKQHYYSYVNNHLYSIGFLGKTFHLAPAQTVTTGFKLYSGPELTNRLEKIAPGLDLTIDYGWLWFISTLIFWLMEHIYNIIGNWGWSIVLVTVLIKLVFYKLSATSYRSMAKMRLLQPKIATLKERFGEDKQAFSRALMELYRKEKANPLSGCLPILIQIPVFISLYWVLIESIQLRHAPFIFWIHDLSTPDPYYVLPILMGVSMFVQQKMSPAPPDPLQAKLMMALPLVFTVFFLHFPSGLVLYWVVNNSLSILQQWFITRKIESENQRRLPPVKKSI